MAARKKTSQKRDALADAIQQAKKAAGDSHVVRSTDLTRAERERLERAGWLQRIMKGWYLLAPPGPPGDTTPYYANFWDFASRYLGERFGTDYCLSPNDSLRRHLDRNHVPQQLSVLARSGGTDTIHWLHGTSVIAWQPADFPARVQMLNGVNALPLPDAIVRVPANAWQRDPTEMEIAMRQVKSPLDLAKAIVESGSPSAASRIIGAYEFLGDNAAATRIRREVEAAGLRVTPANPFEHHSPRLGTGAIRIASPYAARVTALWAQMREQVMAEFPAAPGLPRNKRDTLKGIEEIYVHDAYHSLSIEGYSVTETLIEHIREHGWDPDNNAADASERDALATKGYAAVFEKVKTDVAEILEGNPAGAVADQQYPDWYRTLFQPGVDVGIITAADLVGFRNNPVYIRNAVHVPPPHDAVTDAMETFGECLRAEPEPAVRAVLGHFLFTYIHPYMDGNGRIARFLMNTQLVSGGYPWTVVRSDRKNRNRYMKSLDRASAEKHITDFARCIRDNMENPPENA